jgi:hypothetical protein
VTWFRYARHHDVEALTGLGWFACSDLGPTHGHWSILMQWGGAGEPQGVE